MQGKKKSAFTYITGAILLFIALTYYFFPTPYVALSQRIFSPLYRNSQAPLPQDLYKEELQKLPEAVKEMLPLYVLAQPPQTPYDFLIVTEPEQSWKELEDKSALIGKYVYNATGTPIGCIHEEHEDVFVVILFSSPESREIFSVGDYVKKGEGTGNGGFYIQTPIDETIKVGMPIVHQPTGIVISHIIAIEKVPEKNIQRVMGTLDSNPLQTALVYVPPYGKEVLMQEEIDTAIEKARERPVQEPELEKEVKQEEEETTEEEL